MRAPNFMRSTASTLVTRVLIMGLTSLVGIVAARALGPTNLGAFTVALAVPALVSLFLQFGLGVANVYYLGQGTYPVEVLVGNVLSLSLITSCVVVPAYMVLVPVFTRTVAVGVDPAVLVLVGSSIPFALVGGHLSFIFLGLQDIREYNVLRLIRNGGALLLLAIFVLAFQMRVMGAVLAMTLAWALMLVRGLWALRRRTAIRLTWDWKVLSDCLKLGLKGYLANLFQFFNYRLDVLLLSFFTGVTAVGVYATAVAAAEVLWYVPEAAGTVLFPRTAISSHAEASSFTPVVTRSVFSLTLVFGLIVGALSFPLIVLLFGTQYEASVLPLRLLLPGVVTLSLAKVLSSDLGGRGLLLYNTLAALTGLVATVVLDVALIPRFGINGAAIASSMSYTLNTAVVLAAYVGASGNPLAKVLIPQPADLKTWSGLWGRLRGAISPRGRS